MKKESRRRYLAREGLSQTGSRPEENSAEVPFRARSLNSLRAHVEERGYSAVIRIGYEHVSEKSAHNFTVMRIRVVTRKLRPFVPCRGAKGFFIMLTITIANEAPQWKMKS